MVKYYHLFSAAFIISLLFAGSMGCGPSNRPADMPPLHRCLLTFTQEGAPLEGAMIILQSTEPGFKWSVGGRTDAKGVADVVTHGQFFGAPEGTYKVVVSKTESVQEGAPKELPPDVDPASIMVPSGALTVYTFVEKEFAEAETTPLKVTIQKGKNEATFECGKPVKQLLRHVTP